MIYLDANATSALRGAAEAAIREQLSGPKGLGNASSVHRLGQNARALLSHARSQVLSYFGFACSCNAEVVFTSGGTEGCNTCIYGIASQTQPAHIITTAIEHSAILEPLRNLERQGWNVEYLPPASDGIVAPESFIHSLRPDTKLVSVMAVNNESGAIQPLLEIVRALRDRRFTGVVTSDGVQAMGKSTLDLPALFEAGLDMMAFAGHKIGAGLGAGILVTRATLAFRALIQGGSQENWHRAGTENLLAISALGATLEQLSCTQHQEMLETERKRNLLWNLLEENLPNLILLTPAASIPNTLFIRVAGCSGADLVVALDLRGVAISTGSACHSGKQHTSHVAQAMGLKKDEASEVIRLSIDWCTTEMEIREAAVIITDAVRTMRKL